MLQRIPLMLQRIPLMLQRIHVAWQPLDNAVFMYNTDISQPGIKRDLVPQPPTPPRSCA